MKLLLYYEGQQYNIYAIACDDGSCPAFDFLERVKRDNNASYKSLIYLLARHADIGQLRNKKKSRAISGRENRTGRLFEFKTTTGDRLLYFYQQGQKTILIHGFHKGDPIKTEIKKAEAMRDQYLREGEDG